MRLCSSHWLEAEIVIMIIIKTLFQEATSSFDRSIFHEGPKQKKNAEFNHWLLLMLLVLVYDAELVSFPDLTMYRYGKGGTLPLYQTKTTTQAAKAKAMRPAPGNNLGLFRQFEISPHMMFASVIFRICILNVTYIGITYLMTYRSFNDSQLEEVCCCGNFGGTLQDNRIIIETYPKPSLHLTSSFSLKVTSREIQCRVTWRTVEIVV